MAQERHSWFTLSSGSVRQKVPQTTEEDLARTHVPLEEREHLGIRVRAVRGLREAMRFVLIPQVVDLATAIAQRPHDLLRLDDRDTRIVRAMDDHQGRPDP